MVKNKVRFFIVSLLFPVQLFCQRPSTGVWLTAQLPIQLNSKWQVHNDFTYRTLGYSTSSLQNLYRLGIRYTINKNWSTTLGGAFSFTRTSFNKENDEFAKEFRIWEELNYKNDLADKLHLQIRLRTEERSFSGTSSKDAYHTFRYRIKPQLVQQINTKWALLVSNEYMQQLINSKWSFDQNRFMVSGIYTVTAQTQLQAGYMWLQWPQQSVQHIITLSFQQNISLHAKQ